MSRTDFSRSFEISPIILVGGLAGDLPGAVLPIVNLTDAQDYPGGPTQQADIDAGYLPGPVNQDGTDAGLGGLTSTASSSLGRFVLLPGGTLIDNQVGQYPFANQSVAANAIITQPLAVSLRLICPVTKGNGGYAARLATMTNIQNQLAKHSNMGGLFNVQTPSFLYTDCILLKMTDTTGGETHQAQASWQFDFWQPLVTRAQAQAAMNLLMNKMDKGLRVTGDPPQQSGRAVGVGSSATLQGPSAVPAAQPLGGAAGSGSPG